MIIAGQTATSSTAGTPLCTIPPGQCSVVIAANGGTAIVGPTPASGQALTSSTGFQVVSGAAPTSFQTFPNSKGTGLSVVSPTTASTVTVSFLISTNT